MARLTILQASQQGFGSTLTIHRHIKEGSLPVYEEGDNKLLEVDDLISLLGEPGTPVGAPVNDHQTADAPDRVDIYEYNRMKSELDQKNKKNMWLAADLAEVVRELKEKEIKFDAERDRLLKVLEQAQALLLREGQRAAGGRKNGDGSALTPDQAAPVVQPGSSTSGDETSSMSSLAVGEQLPPNGGDSGAVRTVEAEAPDADTKDNPPTTNVHDKKDPQKRAKRRNSVNPINPMTPPLRDAIDEPKKSGLIGITTVLLLLALVGVGFVFFKFRIQIMSSVAQILQTLGGA